VFVLLRDFMDEMQAHSITGKWSEVVWEKKRMEVVNRD
jgi:hypothetical protein